MVQLKNMMKNTHKIKLKQTYHELFFLCILWILIINCYVNSSIWNTPLLSKVPSEESFRNYSYEEHSNEEHDDSPISILNSRSEGELIFNDNPTGENEFEEIMQNEESINVEKDDDLEKKHQKNNNKDYKKRKKIFFLKSTKGKGKIY